MTKIDLAKTDRAYYAPPAKPVEARFGPLQYIAIDGRGAPGGAEHAAATEAQYTVAYTLKFASKDSGVDWTVPKQEGLWWFDEGEHRPAAEVPRDQWNWTLLIRLPVTLDAAAFAAAVDSAARKKPERAEVIGRVELRELDEGRVVQMLHTGPFETEPETQAVIQQYMAENRLKHNGHHHEIYLSDIRKLPPERWRTILRYPVIER